MTPRSPLRALCLLFLLVVLVACGDDAEDGSPAAPGDGGSEPSAESVPDRTPDVSGVLVEASDAALFRLGEASDSYYAEMAVVGGSAEPAPLVVDTDGEPLAVDELEGGQPVEVWTTRTCAESYPVQCGIEALRVSASTSR